MTQDALTSAHTSFYFWDIVCPWPSVNDSEDHGAPKEGLRLSESSPRGSETNICCSVFQTFVGISITLRACLIQVAGPHLQSFWFPKSGVESKNLFSNKFPGDANAASPGATLCEPDIVLGTWSHLILTTE